MILATLTLAAALAAPQDPVAIRVGRAETGSDGTIEHAVLLVEGGKIVAVGSDLPIERGIPIIDRPDWVATPGFVNCYTRLGMAGSNGQGFEPQLKASGELYARQEVWKEVLELGFTTLGLHAPGGGIPGQSVVVRPHGKSAEAMIVADPAYLEITLQSNAGSKKMLREAFEKVDDHDEKVQKAREKWEKAEEKRKKDAKKKKKKDDDEDKGDEKKAEKDAEDDSKPEPFVAPEPDEKVVPFIALRQKELAALFLIGRSSDYLHLLDALGDEDIEWSLQARAGGDSDLQEIAERVGEAERRIALLSHLTLRPGTLRERNLPAEFDRAGAKVALLPQFDSVSSFESWRFDVGHLVAAGLDRDAAVRAMTLEPAHVLGVEDRLGSLEEGKDANILLWDGDPFEPQSRLRAVMLEGEVVEGEVW